MLFLHSFVLFVPLCSVGVGFRVQLNGFYKGSRSPTKGPVSRQHGVVKTPGLSGKAHKLNDQDLSIVKG